MDRLDITRLNRAERRKLGKRLKATIPGRNLPYQTKLHGTVENFYKTREQELSQEQENG